MRKLLFMFVLSVAAESMSHAQTVRRLVPIFAENVPGANESTWQSELRLYNATDVNQTVNIEKLMPMPGSICAGIAPIVLQPRQLRQVRSVGCSSGAAAFEIDADSRVEIQAPITNLAAAASQDACCLAGFTQTIQPVPLESAYSNKRTVSNLQIPYDSIGRHLTRHNVGLVNPNDFAIEVRLSDYDALGGSSWRTDSPVVVPARSVIQLNDYLQAFSGCCIQGPPPRRGFFRVDARSEHLFYLYDSAVDNQTNDATFISQ